MKEVVLRKEISYLCELTEDQFSKLTANQIKSQFFREVLPRPNSLLDNQIFIDNISENKFYTFKGDGYIGFISNNYIIFPQVNGGFGQNECLSFRKAVERVLDSKCKVYEFNTFREMLTWMLSEGEV